LGILVGTATSTVVPFFQAIAGKAADDAYAALRAVLRKKPGEEKPPEDDDDRLSFFDPEHDVRIVAPDPVPREAIRQLSLMRPADVKGHVLIWDKEGQSWRRYRRRP
jgi:hypothetical protein